MALLGNSLAYHDRRRRDRPMVDGRAWQPLQLAKARDERIRGRRGLRVERASINQTSEASLAGPVPLAAAAAAATQRVAGADDAIRRRVRPAAVADAARGAPSSHIARVEASV